MTRERAVFTNHDGGVGVFIPCEECIEAMASGGYWDHMPAGYFKVQIQRQIEDGISPESAKAFAEALHFGGVSREDAIRLIAHRDCERFGVAVEIVDVSDIPADRTHRLAWRRSQNGGPIWIDDMIALKIDEQRAWSAYEGRNART